MLSASSTLSVIWLLEFHSGMQIVSEHTSHTLLEQQQQSSSEIEVSVGNYWAEHLFI